MIKWGLITFGIGMTATDKKSIIGLFWLSLFAAGLVMSLVYMS